VKFEVLTAVSIKIPVFLAIMLYRPWRWRQQVLLKCFLFTKLQNITSQQTVSWINIYYTIIEYCNLPYCGAGTQIWAGEVSVVMIMVFKIFVSLELFLVKYYKYIKWSTFSSSVVLYFSSMRISFSKDSWWIHGLKQNIKYINLNGKCLHFWKFLLSRIVTGLWFSYLCF
jgi:hypothetical protein